MAKTPAKLKKPEPRACGDIRYRVVRGPREADGRWYWRAERYFSGGGETVWTGWGTVGEADQQVARLAGGKAATGGQAETVRDLLAYWLGAQEERQDIAPATLVIRTYQCKAAIGGMGAVRLDRLDRGTMERHRDQRLRAGAAPRSVAGEIGVLRQAWRWGRECGLCPDRELPGVRVKIETRRKTPAPRAGVVTAALEHLTGWRRLAVLLLEGTGCRLGEIADLTWAQVDFQLQEIEVRGKTGARRVPLLPQLVTALEEARPPDPRPEARVLGVSASTSRSLLRRDIAAACAAAGVARFSAQGLRKAAVGALYRSGVDVGTAAAVLGHSPAVALSHYRDVTEEDRRDALLRSGLGRAAETAPPAATRPQRVYRRIRR